MFYIGSTPLTQLLIPSHLLEAYLHSCTRNEGIIRDILLKLPNYITFKSEVHATEVTLKKVGNLQVYTDVYHHDILEETFYTNLSGEDAKAELRERFLEEAFELYESLGGTPAQAVQMMDHVFLEKEGVGEIEQELRGVVSPLMHLAAQHGTDLLNVSKDSSAYLNDNLTTVTKKDRAKPRYYKESVRS